MTEIPADRKRWQRIEALLDEALELEAEDRPGFLDRACEGDAELRSQVEALLEADEQSEDFMESSASGYAATLLDEIRRRDLAREAGDLEGRQLGPYQVERMIGGGGMGVIYEARDTRLLRQVALKLLPGAWSRDPEAQRRFRREARAASALDHPNICTIYDIGESDDGRIYIVMAYYPGETLERKLERGPLPVEQARQLAIQVARGLARAHEAGITHRDVKPANVMVTDHGDAKVLDFGIAKVTGDAGMTRAGTSPGTPAYMSPEQARGEAADERSDIWSLGVLLFEMLSGRRPFSGDNAQAVIYAILNGEPERLDRVRPGVPRLLTRVVARALAHDRDQRYPRVTEMLADLEAATATGRVAAVARPSGARIRGVVLAMTVAAATVFGLGWWLRTTGPPAELGPVVEAGGAPQPKRSSVAVFAFRNLSGDPEVDWLRAGLTEMLITDLSQSPGINVLTPARLEEVLTEIGAPLVQEPTAEHLRALAEQAGVGTVLLGSFIRQGEDIRIHFKVQAPVDGSIVTGDRLSGRLETGLFTLVDNLSETVRRSLAVPERAERATSVEEITTSSLEAWRYYSQGRELHLDSKVREAIPLYEKAVTVDPEFALALANLGNLHSNLGHDQLARDFSRRAVEHADRLPIQQRYFVEGELYSVSWATLGRAAESFQRGLELFPDELGLRRQLAANHADLERYEEAIAEYQVLIDRNDRFPGTYWAAAMAHGALDRFDQGHRLLAELTRRSPDNWFAQLALGWHLTQWGKFDGALVALERAEQLRPGDGFVRHGWWRLRILQQDWEAAVADATAMSSSTDSYTHWRGSVDAAWTHLYLGESRQALGRFAESRQAYSEPEAYTALSRCWAARLLLSVGEPKRALAEAQAARREAPGQWPELEGAFLAALAEQALGRPAAADAILAELRARAAKNPNSIEQRQLHRLAGRLLLGRGDVDGALGELEAAAALLAPRGLPINLYYLPDHVPLWYALGEAERAAGRPAAAAEWFRKVAESGVEHIEHPVLFVRGFLRLGKIYDDLGEPAKATEAYRAYLGYWRDGDLDRAQVLGVAATITRRPSL